MMQRLSILVFHRVLAHSDPLQPSLPDIGRFSRLMAALKTCFRVLPLSQAVTQLRNGTLPTRAACITFDDGYADNALLALPVLQRFQLPATFFIASDYLNGGQMWNDDVIVAVRAAQQTLDARLIGCGNLPLATLGQRQQAIDCLLERLKYLPCEQRARLARKLVHDFAAMRQPPLMMCNEHLLRLHAAGMEIGAHTASHPILATLSDATAYAELARGKAALEQITQTPVSLFAYPNGKPPVDYDQRHVDMVRQLGFTAACSTVAEAAHAGSDTLQLPRYTPWEADRPRFLLRLLCSRHC